MALLVGEAIYLWPRLHESWTAVREIHWGWLAACVFAQAVSLSAYGRVQKQLLDAGGVKVRQRKSVAVIYGSSSTGFSFFWTFRCLALVASINTYAVGGCHRISAIFIGAEFTGELSGAAGESVRSTLAELDSAAVNFIRLSTTGVAWVGRMGIGSGWLVFASVVCGAGLVCPE